MEWKGKATEPFVVSFKSSMLIQPRTGKRAVALVLIDWVCLTAPVPSFHHLPFFACTSQMLINLDFRVVIVVWCGSPIFFSLLLWCCNLVAMHNCDISEHQTSSIVDLIVRFIPTLQLCDVTIPRQLSI